MGSQHFYPISIKLRTAEFRISELLEGTRRFATSVRPTVRFERFTKNRKDNMPSNLFTQREHEPRCGPLNHLSCFEETASWIVPAALQCDPMRHQDAQQLRIELGQDTLRLAAPPRINLAFLFTELPKQFNLPAQTHQGRLCRKDEGVMINSSLFGAEQRSFSS
jgi:hypothetical protein